MAHEAGLDRPQRLGPARDRAGTLTGALAETLRPVQTGFVRHYALLVLAGAVAIVSYLLWS